MSNKYAEMKCEGACEKHVGEIVHVQVISPKGYDWGDFLYCEEAVAEDRRRDFTVRHLTTNATELTKRCVQP